MSFKTNLTQLKVILEAEFPPLLVAAVLDPMDEFVYYGSSQSTILSVSVYQGNNDDSPDELNFRPLVMLQLYAKTGEDSIDYEAILFDLIKDIEPVLVSMSSYIRMRSETYPADDNGSTIVLFFPEWKKMLDDCG